MRVRITQAGMRLVVVGKAERGRFTPPEAGLPTAWLLSIETGSAAPAAHVAASPGGAGAATVEHSLLLVVHYGSAG